MNADIDRRSFIAYLSLPLAGLLSGPRTALAAATATGPSASSTLDSLLAGNARFATGKLAHPHQHPIRREELAAGQAPPAIVLGCSDSRVSPTIVFDQGLGDLFVVRIAGNYADSGGIGSIEYAAEHLHASLLIVLGHENCGAVAAAVDSVTTGAPAPGHLEVIVKAIAPAVKRAQQQAGDLLENSIIENVRLNVERLKTSQPVLAGLVARSELRIVGGLYRLRSGRVELIA